MRFVSVLPAIVYCERKSAVDAVLVTRAVPFPVSVPVPLMTDPAAGTNVTPDAMVTFPDALKLRFELNPLVLLTLTLLNVMTAPDEPPRVVAAAEAGVLKLIVLAVVNEKGVPEDVLTIQLAAKE